MPSRMNIYIPDDLREMMDQFEGVNWSKIAQDAFADELSRLRTSFVKRHDITKPRASKKSVCSNLRATKPRS